MKSSIDGKTVRTAIDEGFRHAMPAIIDSNVSTILTAAVLYQYGTGAVKGFAVTLIAGIFASLDHVDLRRAHLLSPVAEPLARRPDVEHLRAHAAHSSRHKYDFIKFWKQSVIGDHRVHRAGRDRSWRYTSRATPVKRSTTASSSSVELSCSCSSRRLRDADVVRSSVDARRVRRRGDRRVRRADAST